MKVPKTALTAQEGVHAVGQAVTQMGWLFREQAVHDFGIDAIVEVVADDKATGQLLALQVKAGASAVAERTHEGIVFRGHTNHLDYWLSHALPVVVVLYDPETEAAYWQVVREETVRRTKKGWKLSVPLSQQLGAGSRSALAELAAGDPYVLRLRALRLDLPWMRMLHAQDGRMLIEADEWVNKSSGRGEIRLIIEDTRGDASVKATWQILAGHTPFSVVLPALFPWAALSVDELFGSSLDEIGPYDEDGEVAFWRLEAELNAVGAGFLAVDKYLHAQSGAT